MTDIFFVSIGAILGANTRFQISKKLEKLNLRKDFFILIINTFASFFLGLFLSLMQRFSSFIYSYQLVLFFSIGFFGSLSTFSSFVYDLFDLCLNVQFSKALQLFILSYSIAIIAIALGLFLGNQ